jgi:hypothetical protein
MKGEKRMKIIKELFKSEYSPFEVLGWSISTGLIADGNIGYGLLLITVTISTASYVKRKLNLN